MDNVSVQRRSRRALLGAAVGGLAAAAAAATLGRVSPVAAANGDTVQVGGFYIGSDTTTLSMNEPEKAAFVGANVGNGYGVWGQSENGIGLIADSFAGTALWSRRGRIRINEVSGVATIAAGKKSVTVSPGVDINAQTFVLLTPMTNLGSRALWFTKSATADTFTIRMSSPRSRGTKVAWLALERG